MFVALRPEIFSLGEAGASVEAGTYLLGTLFRRKLKSKDKNFIGFVSKGLCRQTEMNSNGQTKEQRDTGKNRKTDKQAMG